MIRHLGSGQLGRVSQNNRNKKQGGIKSRRLAFESLEVRQLLTVAAPTSIVFQPLGSQGTATLTAANNSSPTPFDELQFTVGGVTAGNTVNIYVDGGATPVATGTVAATNTSITLTTDGSSTIPDGTHTFTATQTDTSSNVSAPSPGDPIQIFSGLTVTNTAAPRNYRHRRIALFRILSLFRQTPRLATRLPMHYRLTTRRKA